LEQGIVKKSNILITVLDSLSLQRIVEKRPAHLSKKGIYFQKIGAHVDLEKGVARSKDVVMRSPVFNAAATGEMDLRTKTIKAEIGVQPLGTLDFLISNLPVAGYLLTGDQEALFVEYFKVNGPVSDPKVEHMSLKSLGNGTVGFLSRLFLAPKRIYDRMVEAARDFDGNGYPAPDEHLDPRNDVGR
ncbi:MAG: AsmA-like C-terminal domain-containing protein, partial [Deltaproteobacteria bacterium]|nr:AsmA-like C-terminal domain-containing protein [Deltaproteobacteria bacterium]